MLRKIENLMMSRWAPRGVRYLQAPRYDRLDSLGERVIGQMSREFALATPITLHLANPLLTAGVWGATREALIVGGAAGRMNREAIATGVSLINACPFCVDAHTAMLEAGQQTGLAADLRLGKRPRTGTEASLEAATAWAHATRTPDSHLLVAAPFSEDDAPRFLATAVVFHYINRMVQMFLEPYLLPLPGPFRGLRGALRTVFAHRFGRRMVTVEAEPGVFLLDLDDTPFPEELVWAHKDSAVAGGLHRLAMTVEQAGRASLDQTVRDVINEALAEWYGNDVDLTGESLQRTLGAVPEELRPAARLALLTALAPYRVDRALMADLRLRGATDAALINIAAWGAFAAARRIGSWL